MTSSAISTMLKLQHEKMKFGVKNSLMSKISSYDRHICTKTAFTNKRYRPNLLNLNQKAIMYFSVHNVFTVQLTSDHDSIYQHSTNKPEVFWADRAKKYLQLEQPFHCAVEGDPQSGIKWFNGGKINVSGKLNEISS